MSGGPPPHMFPGMPGHPQGPPQPFWGQQPQQPPPTSLSPGQNLLQLLHSQLPPPQPSPYHSFPSGPGGAPGPYPPYGYQGPPQGYPPQQSPQQFIPPMPSSIPIPKMSVPSAAPPAAASPTSPSTSSFTGFPLTSSSPSFAPPSQLIENPLPISEIANYPREWDVNVHQLIAVNHHYICYALKNGLLRVISQTTGKNVLLKGHTNNAPILDMSLSPHSSSHLFTLTSQQFIIWSLQQTDDSITYTMILCVDGIYNHGCWHPTKPDVVAVVEGKRVQIWDIQQALRTVKPATTITSSHLTAHPTLFTSTPSHPSPITSLSYSHDGSILATSSQDGLLQLIDSNNHIIRAWYPHNQHVINRVMFLSSGNYTLNDYVLITTAQTGDATTTHRDIKIWASQGKDWLCVHTLKLEKGINDIIYNQVQIDPSGSFMVVSYKTIDPVGRADDYGFFVFHIRRPQHPSTSTWDLIATRFDYVTPYNVPYPLVSFLLLNTTHEWCNDDIHTINNLSIYGVHTKPIQQMILKSHECWKMVLPSAIQPSIVVSSVAVTTDEGKEEKVEDEDEDSDEGEAELGPDSEIYPLKTVDDIEIKDPITGIITTIGERRRSSASGEYPTAMEVGEITTAEIDDNLLHINQSRPTRRSVIEETPTTSTQMESLMDKLVRHANQEVKDENDSVGEMTTQPQPSITITDGLSKRGSVVAIMETNAVLNRESTYVPLKIHDEDEDEEEDRLGMLAGDDSPLSGPSPAASSDRRRPPRTRPNSISLSASQYSGPNVPPSPSFLSQQAAVQATQPPGILYGESDTPSSSPAPSPSMSSSLYINTSAEASHVPPTPASTPTGLSLYARPPRKISTSSALPVPPVGEATVNDFANVPTPSPSLHISTLSPATNTPNPTPRQSIGPTVTTPLLQPSTSSSMIIPPDLSMPVESPSSTLKISTDTRTYQPTPTPASTPTALTAYQTFQRPTTPDMSPASGLPPKARGRVQSISEKKGEYERGILKGAIVKEEDKDEENGDGDGKKKSKSAQETALITRLDKLFARHFAKLVITLENERENEERIQKLVTAMTQVINSQLPQHVETAIKSEVQKNMLPAVGRWLTQLLQKLTTTVLQPALEKTLSQSVTSTLTDPSSLIESLSTSIATSLRQPIQDSFRSSFSTVLLPAFEASTRTMFKQITDTFHAMTEQNKKLLEQQMNVKPVDIKQTNEYKQWEKEKEKARQAHEREMSELRTLRESLASQTSQTSTSTLLAEIRTLTTTVASLMTTNQAMSRQLKEMAQQQQIQGQLIATISEHNSRHTSGSTSPTTSSSSSITNKEIDPKLEITSLLASKQFDTAFIRALSAGSPSLVVWTCSQLDPHVLLRTTIPSHRLSSPVQLSLIQQLGFALNTDTALKLSWLRELCHAMDATDGLIRAHVAPIVKEVLHHFDTQMKDITDDYNNPLYDKALNVKRGLGDLLKMATP